MSEESRWAIPPDSRPVSLKPREAFESDRDKFLGTNIKGYSTVVVTAECGFTTYHHHGNNLATVLELIGALDVAKARLVSILHMGNGG